MSVRDGMEGDLDALARALDAMRDVSWRHGSESSQYFAARDRYDFLRLRWRSRYALVASEGVASNLPCFGKGLRLLVVHNGEPVAESVRVLAKVWGFNAAAVPTHATSPRIQAFQPQIACLDLGLHFDEKCRTLTRLSLIAPDCKVVVVCADRHAAFEMPRCVAAVVPRINSIRVILEHLGNLCERSEAHVLVDTTLGR